MKSISFRLSPLPRLALGLTALSITFLLIGDLLFQISADEALITQHTRKRLAENSAVQISVLLENQDEMTIGKTLSRILSSHSDIRSIGIRRGDGSLYVERGEHARLWQHSAAESSALHQFSIPIYANKTVWLTFEVNYFPAHAPSLLGTLTQPITLLIYLMGIGGFLVYYAYLKRAIRYLDPSNTVPERVIHAFDTLTDAVLILDTEGRILLANRVFQDMNQGPVALGCRIADIPWLETATSTTSSLKPWDRALKEAIMLTDVRMQALNSNGEALELSINCALIQDENDNLRGCLVSLSDQTQLVRANGKLKLAIAEIERSRAQIKAQNEKLQHLASRDPLTGCLNRRAFFEQADPQFMSAQHSTTELCCIMTDIDHFKSFNDVYGHSIGDQVIRTVATNIARQLRQEDQLCRYGGEEFVMLLPGLTALEAYAVAERMRVALEAHGSQGIRDVKVRTITSSFGIASITEGAKTLEQLIEQADIALYASKDRGRNRSSIWDKSMKGA